MNSCTFNLHVLIKGMEEVKQTYKWKNNYKPKTSKFWIECIVKFIYIWYARTHWLKMRVLPPFPNNVYGECRLNYDFPSLRLFLFHWIKISNLNIITIKLKNKIIPF